MGYKPFTGKQNNLELYTKKHETIYQIQLQHLNSICTRLLYTVKYD